MLRITRHSHGDNVSIIVRLEDIEFVCATPQEAAELGRLLREQRNAAVHETVPPDPKWRPRRSIITKPPQFHGGGPGTPMTPDARLRELVTLLSGNVEGVAKEKVAKHLGLASTKGLGPFMGFVRSRLEDVGLDVNNVFERLRLPGGEVRWYAGPQFKDAVDALGRADETIFDRESKP